MPLPPCVSRAVRAMSSAFPQLLRLIRLIIARERESGHAPVRIVWPAPKALVKTGRSGERPLHDQRFGRRSSSAWAKYALALRRISLASRSSRFSRSRAFTRSAAASDAASSGDAARSALRAHLRWASAEHPNFSAIDVKAAHSEASVPPKKVFHSSFTIRTARSRTSGEYHVEVPVLLMAPSSQIQEPPANPGRFSPARAWGSRQFT